MTGKSILEETMATSHPMAESIEGFWHLYLVLLMEYWDLVTAASLAPMGRLHRKLADEQLVVPEPIEKRGEHALFA